MPRSKGTSRTIPTWLKYLVYFLNVNPDEVVDWREISADGPTFWLHLKKGELEWKGHVKAPPWSTHLPHTTIEDLIANTRDCPRCQGSGKVPNG